MRYGKLDGKMLMKRIREDYDSAYFPAKHQVRRTLAVTHLNEYTDAIIQKADYRSDGENRTRVAAK